MHRKIILTICTILIGLSCVQPVLAWEEKTDFPKIANTYLLPNVPKENFDDLAQFDLVILDVDAQTIDPSLFYVLRSENPDIKTLAYIPSQSVNDQDLSAWARFRNINYKKVNEEDWWLLSSNGEIVNFPGWDTINFVDGGDEWNEYLSSLIASDVASRDVWDGIFLDMVFADLCWINNGDIDLDQDGERESDVELNAYWNEHMEDLMEKADQKIAKPVVANLNLVENFEDNLNGVMWESFPSPWFNNAWELQMEQYVNKLPDRNKEPQIYIINSNTDNRGFSSSFKKMRFGLASTLMGDGYYSFDYGSENHGQVWWYDEYSVELGEAKSRPYNLLDKENTIMKSGLWRRDFENGVAIVNSTNETQTFVFEMEEFEKINGSQDRTVNNGAKVNWVKIDAQDGLILLKKSTEIINSNFYNGYFVRVFNNNGEQSQNGFFSYRDDFSPDSDIMITDIDNDGLNEEIVSVNGKISIFRNGKLLHSFYPYNKNYRGKISFAVSDLNGDATKEIITGAGIGGGPHVRIFSKDGEPLIGGFFAYDKNFRGGVSVAVMDLNGDATKEIITGAGIGGGPHVRVFSKDGKPLIGGFFAYDDNFRGGVNVATGDLEGDGVKEIITSPGKGSESKIKIFSKEGELEKEFLAYEKNVSSGLLVSTGDMNNDGKAEILVSTMDY